MQIPFVLLPFFVEVALIFALLFGMGAWRGAAAPQGEMQAPDVARRRRAGRARALDVDDALLPLLFLALAPLAIITRKDDVLFVALAWIFVLLRIGLVATGVAAIEAPRSWLFAASALVLALMWLIFAVQILTGL